MVEELCKGRELFDWLLDVSKFSEGDSREIMWQLVSAVKMMHKQGVMHR